ncbi:uncharacterized protein LOC120010584 [Tripterygium wilfordii]|uniref:uncharacterized protein LOC120010584 n=1 Tax=Tripterygium wilfordii TaxID=458696 RepID=UPI0018F7F99D|nr:uncharacterized protein LOC120010584 [Tripterygium wilfordii]
MLTLYSTSHCEDRDILLVSSSCIIIQVLALNYDQHVVTEERKINKPAVLSTKESLDGELVDFVNTKKQEALDHPLLKGHKFQRVPIRRSTIDDDVMKVNSRSTFRNKQDFSFYRKPHSDGQTERAVARYHSTISRIEGVEVRINLWQPSVDIEKAYSSSQIWIESNVNANGNENRNVIEVGWHIVQDFNKIMV